VMVSRPELVGRIAVATARKVNGFPPFIADTAPVSKAALGSDAGPLGALLLANNMLSDRY